MELVFRIPQQKRKKRTLIIAAKRMTSSEALPRRKLGASAKHERGSMPLLCPLHVHTMSHQWGWCAHGSSHQKTRVPNGLTPSGTRQSEGWRQKLASQLSSPFRAANRITIRIATASTRLHSLANQLCRPCQTVKAFHSAIAKAA